MMQEKQDEERKLYTDLEAMFGDADQDHSGMVTTEELEHLLENPRSRATFRNLGIHVSEARGLFTLLDADSSGAVDICELINGCTRVSGQARSVDVVTLLFENRKVLMKLEDLRKQFATFTGVESCALEQKGAPSEDTVT